MSSGAKLTREAGIAARAGSGRTRAMVGERVAPPRTWRRRFDGLGFALPALLVLAALMFYPMVSVVRYSFYTDVYSRTGNAFVGLQNFSTLLKDDTFRIALRNTVVFTTAHVVLVLVAGLSVAIALNGTVGGRARGLLRTLIMLPWLLSSAVVSAIGVLILSPLGVLNSVLNTIGLLSSNPPWLGQKSTALVTIIAVSVWRGFPFIMVMMLAGLQAIPPELYEAAKVDGANAWKLFRHVTLPQLRGTLYVAALLDTIWNFRLFDLVYIMTGGGPQDATQVIATYTYERGFIDGDFGSASAAAVAMLVFSFVIAVVYFAAERRGGDAS